MKWVISVPAWGQAYVDRFVHAALPSHREALKSAGIPALFVVHTDQVGRILEATAGLDVVIHTVPPGDRKYQSFADAHRETIGVADHGDYVALLCADLVLSREVFAACEARFSKGKHAVVAAATRTLADGHPPAGAASRDLLEWTMRYPHPMVRSCFWGACGDQPWAVYFRRNGHVTLRGFHLHPVAIVKDRPMPFKGTLDQDLLDNFEHEEIHVVTSPDELALAEMSPAGRPFRVARTPISPESIARWTVGRTSAVHWWLSTHRIIIAGHGDTEDEAVWREVMAQPENLLRADAVAA